MAIQGKIKGNKSAQKKVGLFKAKVVAINPTKDELSSLLGTTIEKDLEYTDTADSGAKKLTLSIWVQESKTGQFFPVRFNLEDTIVESKTGKTQFINSIGMTSYAEDKNSLPDWYVNTNRTTRVAKKGEELLYKFLRNWLNNLDYEDPSVELMLDWKKLISGKVTELREAINNYKDQEIGLMATIRTTEDGKEYQSVYSYEFLPAYAIDSITGKSKKSYKVADKFIEKIKDKDYGCKDYYELVPLTDYDSSKNIITSNDAILNTNQSEKSTPLTPISEDDLPF